MTNQRRPAPVHHFTPSSTMLQDMIDRAMKACDADIEQAKLRKDAEAEARMARIIEAEVKGRSYRINW